MVHIQPYKTKYFLYSLPISKKRRCPTQIDLPFIFIRRRQQPRKKYRRSKKKTNRKRMYIYIYGISSTSTLKLKTKRIPLPLNPPPQTLGDFEDRNRQHFQGFSRSKRRMGSLVTFTRMKFPPVLLQNVNL